MDPRQINQDVFQQLIEESQRKEEEVREAELERIIDFDVQDLLDYIDESMDSTYIVESGMRNATNISDGSAIIFTSYMVLKSALEACCTWLENNIAEDEQENEEEIKHVAPKKPKLKPAKNDDEEL